LFTQTSVEIKNLVRPIALRALNTITWPAHTKRTIKCQIRCREKADKFKNVKAFLPTHVLS